VGVGTVAGRRSGGCGGAGCGYGCSWSRRARFASGSPSILNYYYIDRVIGNVHAAVGQVIQISKPIQEPTSKRRKLDDEPLQKGVASRIIKQQSSSTRIRWMEALRSGSSLVQSESRNGSAVLGKGGARIALQLTSGSRKRRSL
jgi:hypothetical protein